MDDVIAAVRIRLRTKVIDMVGLSQPRLIRGDPARFEQDERLLGFTLPSLLKRLYAEIGNGGFGPGYGLIGLSGGVPDDTGKTAPEVYEELRGPDFPNWPSALLPICHWGCAILSCIDCTDPSFRMRVFDPNLREGDDWSDSFFEEAPSFESWIRAWAFGANLWEAMYGERGPIAEVLAQRRSAKATN